ncbi:hypothetical protein TRAPUB_4839 [Trametes pubescens]|uniref:Uncharacterized protein n=1 Tax=Trametes pubescens TaxID=154538 RepID=A0A1M2VAG3_TRAPU|nr:hypothetical protein TRAPUB_4839 [Trametes pubescens]
MSRSKPPGWQVVGPISPPPGSQQTHCTPESSRGALTGAVPFVSACLLELLGALRLRSAEPAMADYALRGYRSGSIRIQRRVPAVWSTLMMSGEKESGRAGGERRRAVPAQVGEQRGRVWTESGQRPRATTA